MTPFRANRPTTTCRMEQSICSPGMSYQDSPTAGRPQYHEMQPAPYPTGHQRNPHQLCVQTEAQFRVADWQQPFDSGVHSLQHSQAPSVLSMTAASSRMSVVSVADTADLTDQQRQKFENIPLSFHAAPLEAASAAIPALVELINDEDEAVAVRALGIIQNTARRDAEMKFQKPIIHQPEAITAIVELLRDKENHPNLLRVALGALFQISLRPEGVHLVFATNQQLGGALVQRLIDFIRYRNSSINVQKWAIPLLHTLLSDVQRSGPNVRLAREAGALEALTYRLHHEATDKLLSIVVQTINILCTKSDAQTKIFIANSGPLRLVYILSNFSYEGLLVGATRLLNKLTPHTEALVVVDAPLAVSRSLSHASPRLVELSLECLRSLSHLRTIQHQPEILQAVLQLLGANKLKLVQHCVDVLINMCAESRPNKEQLCRSHAPQYLLQVLGGTGAFGDEDGRKMEDLHETILRLLRILCHDHQFVAEVQAAVMAQWETFLRTLFEMRPKLLRRTLQLLHRLATNDHNLQTFAEARLMRDKDGFTGFPDQIVYILRVACNQLPSTQVDTVRLADLMSSSMAVLQLICRHHVILQQVVAQLLCEENMSVKAERVFLPVFVLQQNFGNDDKLLKTSALSLLASTAVHPRISAMFASSAQLMTGLQQLRKHENTEYAQLAERAYQAVVSSSGAPQQYPPLRCAPTPQDRSYPPQRPSSPSEELWPEDLSNLTVADDPFVSVFCPATAAPRNTPPFSPRHPSAPPRYEQPIPSWQPPQQQQPQEPQQYFPQQPYPPQYPPSYYAPPPGHYPPPFNGYDPYGPGPYPPTPH